VPLAPSAPLQPPEAAHEVALVELHVSVDAAPLAIDVGAALRDAVGSGLDGPPPPPPPPHAANRSDTPMGMRVQPWGFFAGFKY
jgi:hypothetical protein